MAVPSEIAYLGPSGTFAHIVVKKRYGSGPVLVPKSSVAEVFDYVGESPLRMGVVPLENSSGGVIDVTLDLLGDEHCRLRIEEELRIRVQLALLGHKDAEPTVLYSHFAPLRHSQGWLQANISPEIKRVETPSTAVAANKVRECRTALALASRECAALYGLDVIRFPVSSDVENITQFAVLGHHTEIPPNSTKSTYLVELRDAPGSLCSFLLPFRDNGVNLTRIHSRPVKGTINRYRFFITIDGSAADANVQAAWQTAGAECLSIREFGSYPVAPLYES